MKVRTRAISVSISSLDVIKVAPQTLIRMFTEDLTGRSYPSTRSCVTPVPSNVLTIRIRRDVVSDTLY